MDDDQGREPTQSFHNPDWDRTGPQSAGTMCVRRATLAPRVTIR
jgi:hypothetical protein